MLTLYHSSKSRSTRMLWLLEEIGEPYMIKHVTIRRADGSGGRDPNNPHPEGKVPALVHDGRLVRETGAICLYLTDAFPVASLGPIVSDPDRADYLYWLFNYATDFEPIIIVRMTGAAENPYWLRSYDTAMTRLISALKAGDYLLGSNFSAADILFSTAIHMMRKEFPDDTILDRYSERCLARPAYSRGTARDEQ